MTDLLEKIAQREVELHQKYYNGKYGYHPWEKMPPLMRGEIYDTAKLWLSFFVEVISEHR